MGIILSFLFPRQFMFTEQSSTSSTSSSSSSSIHSLSAIPTRDTPHDESPAASPFYISSSSPSPPAEHPHHPSPENPSTIMESPPLDTHPFIPHAVGLGIASPRPMHGLLSPFHRDFSQIQASSSPIHTRLSPFDSSSLHASSSSSSSSAALSPAASSTIKPFEAHLTRPHNPFEHHDTTPMPSPPLTFGPSSTPPIFPGSALSGSVRSDSPGASSMSNTAGLRLSIPSSSSPLGSSNHSGHSSPVSYSPGFRPTDGSSASALDLSEEFPYPAAHSTHNPFAHLHSDPDPSSADTNVNRVNPQLHLTEFDSEGLSTLERIYLFSRSSVGFHRVFIARALPGLLRAGRPPTLSSFTPLNQSGEGHHDAGIKSDQEVSVDKSGYPDQISPDEAVEYVLPLLSGLAMDEDEAVKEALASELVPIIWWFITHCKIVDDDLLPESSLHGRTPQVDLTHGSELESTSPSDQSEAKWNSSELLQEQQELVAEGSPHTRLGIENTQPPVLSATEEPIAPSSPSLTAAPEAWSNTPDAPAPFHMDMAMTSKPPTQPSALDSHFSDHDSVSSIASPTFSQRPELSTAPTSHAPNPPTLISVQSFTPILGTLLLSSNALVGGPARYAVVELLRRVRRADDTDAEMEALGQRPLESGSPAPSSADESHDQCAMDIDSGALAILPRELTPQLDHEGDSDEDAENEYSPAGLFGQEERRLFEKEIVQQVVIGMSRLDMADDGTAEYGDVIENQEDDSTMVMEPTPGIESSSPTIDSIATPQLPTPMPYRAFPGDASSAEGDSYFPIMAPSPAQEEAVASPGRPKTPVLPSVLTEIRSPPPSGIPLPISSSGVPGPGPFSPPLEFSPPSQPFFVSASPSPTISTEDLDESTPPLTSSTSDSSSSVSSRTPTPPPFQSPLQPPTSADPKPTNTWVPPRSPGDLPPLPAEERKEWEREFLPLSLFRTHGNSEEAWAGHADLTPWGIPSSSPGLNPPGGSREEDMMEEGDGQSDLVQDAAAGRLSSMSLMAAVTANSRLTDDTKTAFVAEVERVGRDSVYWVRREASFALGALAKVVPVEIVHSSLLPLFEALCHDTMWNVRHSALFALPAILARLSPEERRTLALDVITPLSQDESPSVRSGVLEALAEVMYTFHQDPGAPPDELLRLFLGIREGETRRRPKPAEPPPRDPNKPMSWDDLVAAMTKANAAPEETNYDIYDDPTRPLVCAFNYPAVALTLGRPRWGELRELYRELSQHSSLKVRRTLAASLGQMAKIVGPEHANEDIMGVWWSSIRADEGEVRLKAVESLDVFVGAIGVAQRSEILNGIVDDMWDTKLKGWRERECVMKAVVSFMKLEGVDVEALKKLLRKGLEDSVAAVREAAVSAVPSIVAAWPSLPNALEPLFSDIRQLASSGSYRKRMIYVACKQEVVLSDQQSVVLSSEEFWETIFTLAEDSIVDVRIRVARLLGILYDKAFGNSEQVKRNILELAHLLSQDVSQEVKAFCYPILNTQHPTLSTKTENARVARMASNFSRPPPPAAD